MSDAIAAPAAPAAPSSSSSPAAPSAPSPTQGSTPVKASTAPAAATAAAVKAPVGETPAAKQARVLKGKVNGKETSWDLDSMKDDELVTELQLAKAARVKMQEASEVQKAARELFDHIKRDPWTALKDPAFGGLDLEQLAQDRLVKSYEEKLRTNAMSPEAREAEKWKAEAEKYKTDLTKHQEEQTRVAQEAMYQKVAAETQTEFLAALDASGLPKTKATLKMMAEVGHANLEHGIEMTASQMAAEVGRQIGGLHQHVTGGLKGEALIKHLGPDVVKEVLRHQVALARAAKGIPAPGKAKPPVADGDKLTAKNMKASPAELRRYMKGWND